jgi:hypothetical protein
MKEIGLCENILLNRLWTSECNFEFRKTLSLSWLHEGLQIPDDYGPSLK